MNGRCLRSKMSQRGKEKAGGQDKSTVATERPSRCLHIQDLSLAICAVSPRLFQCHGATEWLRLYLGVLKAARYHRGCCEDHTSPLKSANGETGR